MLMKFWIDNLSNGSQIAKLSLHSNRAISASKISSLLKKKSGNAKHQMKKLARMEMQIEIDCKQNSDI